MEQAVMMSPSVVKRRSAAWRSAAWLSCVFFSLGALHTHATDVLPVPQQMSSTTNFDAQELSLYWLGGTATTFDLMILRTELNESVYYETVSVVPDGASGRHRWNWTSVEPLECTSLSIKIRSRDGQRTSDWSDMLILQGKDLPTNQRSQMYPQDKVVPAGANTTFCCIVEEGKVFGSISYRNSKRIMSVTRLSRRTYAMTSTYQEPSGRTGTNVICCGNQKETLTGSVVFVGYPPLPSDLVCETQDLKSAVCQWKEGRHTHLYGRKRMTYFSLNGRGCPVAQLCNTPQWDGNWTLVAVNPLGQYSLTDSAELSHRIRPVPPENLTFVSHAWNASVLWEWRYQSYNSLGLVCQANITNNWRTTTRTFSGVGLRSAVLLDLQPDEEYSIRVRCGAQKNFWKWGDWSDSFSFQTSIDVPNAPDVWMWMNRDNTGRVVWKPLTRRESHSMIIGYEVTLWSPDENIQHTETVPRSTCFVPVNLTHITTNSDNNKVVATVIAKNDAGVSQPASLVLPLHVIALDVEAPTVSRAVYADGGFPLFWQNNANATCGYVVQWHDSFCTQDCPVEWTKVKAGTTNVSFESDNFLPGVRYTFSLYSCSSQAPELLQQWQGYMQELVPSSFVPYLSISQKGSDVHLSWGEIPMTKRRGFLQGYNVYISSGSQLKLIANLSDPESRRYIVKGLSEGPYKFTVKAYTSAGQDTGATASITVELFADWLILEILASLGTMTLFLVIVTFICYKKRKWVKKAFYPDIPEPKLPGDWSRTQGPLNVKPSPHSMVHIVERPEWDSSKEALVVIPEEDEDEEEGQRIGDEPVDTDEPTSLRYYNQVVDERPIRPRYPDSSDSSASSLDSGRTDVTYTGIQTSGSSMVFQLEPQGSSEPPQPQLDLSSGGNAGGGYRPQMQPEPTDSDSDVDPPEPFLDPESAITGGYQPQSSWHLDSPTEAGEGAGRAPSLGSPTSVASTQFLLPDGESEESMDRKRQVSSSPATWFTNLMSSTKP